MSPEPRASSFEGGASWRARWALLLGPAAGPSRCVHVGRRVDDVGEGLDLHIKPLLHLVEHLAVGLAADERDGQALGAKAPGAAHLGGGVGVGAV
jgi:hypothetical protein